MTSLPSCSDEHPLAPLLFLAREKSPDERRRWLATLRADAPTLVAALEHLLHPPRTDHAAARPLHAERRDCRLTVRALRWIGLA